MIAISNPAGALCASDSIRPVPGPLLTPSATNTSGGVLSGPRRPRARQRVRARKVGGVDEDNRNGHLLREETGDKGRNLAGRHRDIESISRNYPDRRRLSLTQ